MDEVPDMVDDWLPDTEDVLLLLAEPLALVCEEVEAELSAVVESATRFVLLDVGVGLAAAYVGAADVVAGASGFRQTLIKHVSIQLLPKVDSCLL